jgi:hypothetical protein
MEFSALEFPNSLWVWHCEEHGSMLLGSEHPCISSMHTEHFSFFLVRLGQS